MEDKIILSLAAILSLTVLEVCAMLHGIDGYLFGIIVAAIAGISGFEIKDLINKQKQPSQ